MINPKQYSNRLPSTCRWCPRGPICQVSAPQTEEDTEEATPEGEAEATAPPGITTAHEAASGTSPPGRSIKRLILTMEVSQWGRDSGDTWTTMSRCPNVTRVFFSSRHPLRNWGRGQVDSTTPSSASTDPQPPSWVGANFNQCFQALMSWLGWDGYRMDSRDDFKLHLCISSSRCEDWGQLCCIISFCCCGCMGQSSNCYAVASFNVFTNWCECFFVSLPAMSCIT